jgi:uncharacterized phage protein (TIGR01671 family)
MDGIAYAIRGGKRMNRIQFRAWYPERQKMYEVAKIDMWGDPDQATCDLAAVDEELFDIYLNDVELMQYIGRKDINGKEICEGDIVSFDDCTSTESGYWERGCIGVVKWCNETVSFEVSNRLSAESYEVLDECVVIGNIYENPELLD